ncbi:MAG: esterase family protein [Treponema sp.]|jgi:putative tributyrin esterase|nr:esterase family protein [Treponema sp.]
MARFSCNFISYTLQRTVDITVIIPSVTIPESIMALGMHGNKPDNPVSCSHTKNDKYPVLYLLHGYGNNHATWNDYTRIGLFAEEQNIAVVMLSAENKFYLNHRDDDKYYDFIQNELPDFVKGMFPVSARAEDTFIAGLSMGGFGALAHAFSNPEKYAAIGAFSAVSSLDLTGLPDSFKEQGKAYDPLANAKKRKEEGRKLPKIYIACGQDDHIHEASVKFKDELIALGGDVTWDSVPAYSHEWRFWDLQVEKFLNWIPRTDSFAKAGKRQV